GEPLRLYPLLCSSSICVIRMATCCPAAPDARRPGRPPGAPEAAPPRQPAGIAAKRRIVHCTGSRRTASKNSPETHPDGRLGRQECRRALDFSYRFLVVAAPFF